MEVPYDEGVACRIGPVPCAVDREVGGEALVRGDVGWALSREAYFGALTGWVNREGNTEAGALTSPRSGSTWSETPCTR